jgi:Zn-dependent protease with chaperone function
VERSFSGGVFCDSIDGGRAGAEIELQPVGIRARLHDGSVILIAYRQCQIEVGGFSGQMVFCRTPDRSVTIFCEQRGFPRALSDASSGILDEQLGEGLRQRRGEAIRGRLVGTAVLVGIVTLLVAGYFGIRVGAHTAVRSLPVAVDNELGSAAFQSLDLGGPKVSDEVVLRAMQTIVDQLRPHAAIEGLEYEVHVVDSPVVNAFALPGGKIVMFTGLIEKSDTPEQVAGVIGHEISHATLRHGLERISQSMGLWAAASLLLGDTGGIIASGAEVFQMATINSYSRQQENDADVEGVRMLHAAGIDPLGLAEFFAKLEKEHGDFPGAVSWISTHPQHAERIESVREQVAGLPPRQYKPIPIDWQDVKRRIENDK